MGNELKGVIREVLTYFDYLAKIEDLFTKLLVLMNLLQSKTSKTTPSLSNE